MCINALATCGDPLYRRRHQLVSPGKWQRDPQGYAAPAAEEVVAGVLQDRELPSQARAHRGLPAGLKVIRGVSTVVWE